MAEAELELAFQDAFLEMRSIVGSNLRAHTLVEGVFDGEQWNAVVSRHIADPLGDQVVKDAMDTATAVVPDHVLQRHVADHVGAVRAMAPHIDESVQGVLSEAFREELTLGETMQRLEDVGGLSQTSAFATARTELNGISQGAIAASIAHDEKTGAKIWHSVGDDRTRPSHLDMEGIEVSPGGLFLVGGFEARAPGDPMLPLEERIFCRCWIAVRALTGEEREARLQDAPHEQLLEQAAKLGIEGRSKMEHPELRAAIRERRLGVDLPIAERSHLGLMATAAQLDIPGRHRMSRRQLIEAIERELE
jgi:hypothetical protein